MTATVHPFKDALAAEQHPHDPERFYADRGDSSMVMPNGSVVSLSHRAPFELAASMTIAVEQAWRDHEALLVELHTYSWPPHEGNAYCPRCRCNKSGHLDEPNPKCPPCEDGRCLCHDEEQP